MTLPSDSSGQTPLDPEEEQILIGALLARANLLRMRQQWSEAIGACAEALQKAPNSATAHSLMGQIYEEQGRNDDAITWYGLALSLNPHSVADRTRWERLTQIQRTKLREPATPVTNEPKPALTQIREKTIDRTLNWLDKLFPPGQSKTIARYIYAVCGVILVLMLASAGILFLVSPRTEIKPENSPILTAPPVVVPPPVEGTTNDNRTVGTATTPTNKAEPSPSPTSSPSSAVANSATSPNAETPPPPPPTPVETAEDKALRDALNQSSQNTYQITALQRIPLNNGATTPTGASNPLLVRTVVDMLVPFVRDTTETRTHVIRAAALTAYLTLGADKRIREVVIRVAVTGVSQQPIPFFQCAASPESMKDIDPVLASTERLAARFTQVQWLYSAGNFPIQRP